MSEQVKGCFSCGKELYASFCQKTNWAHTAKFTCCSTIEKGWTEFDRLFDLTE